MAKKSLSKYYTNSCIFIEKKASYSIKISKSDEVDSSKKSDKVMM